MNVNETIAKLAMIGLKGKFHGTGHADYERVYVIQAPLPWAVSPFSTVRTAISNGIPASSKPTTLTSDVRRSPGDMLLQTGQVLTDEMWSNIKLQARRIQEEEVHKLELWRIGNPPGVDHLGRVKRRRSIKGSSLMKCIRQVMNLTGAY